MKSDRDGCSISFSGVLSMKVVILCGGQGSRIREASESIPKPLLPIGGRPILWHIMKGYAAHGFHDFVLCLGYKGWLIKEYFLNYRAMTSDLRVRPGRPESLEFLGEPSEEDWSVVLAETGETTNTGGRIAAIRRYVADDDLFLLTYGDGVADVDLSALVSFHRAHGRIATVTAVRPPSRFGEMALEGQRVVEFNEKRQTTAGAINGGYFVCDARRLWDYLGDERCSFEMDSLRRLTSEGELVAYEHPGFWQPMDTPREYHLLNELWARGDAPWQTWARPRR